MTASTFLRFTSEAHCRARSRFAWCDCLKERQRGGFCGRPAPSRQWTLRAFSSCAAFGPYMIAVSMPVAETQLVRTKGAQSTALWELSVPPGWLLD